MEYRTMIACSPSTGSSLLRRLLNRHSRVFCGSETNLLCKKALYTDWERYRSRLTQSFPLGQCNAAWPHFRGISLDEEYAVSQEGLRMLAQETSTFQDFIDAFFKPSLLRSGKALWVEKTPSNALCASDFLEMFDNARLIHIYRNPYDVIASLTERGMSVYNAMAVCLINMSSLVGLHNRAGVYSLSYESLVHNPEETMKGVFSFLDLPYEAKVFNVESEAIGKVRMKGWNYRETDSIGTASVSRFESLTAERRSVIIQASQCMTLNDQFQFQDLESLCNALSYSFLSGELTREVYHQLRKARTKDLVARALRMSYFNPFNYPVNIRYNG